MNEQIKEQLSALMDGELASEQARFLHKRLETDVTLRADWSRWHAARDALQGRSAIHWDPGFGERIAACLRDEAAPRSSAWQGALRWSAGVAVAASVAVAAIVSLPRLADAPTLDSSPVAAQSGAMPVQVVDSGVRETDLRPSLGAVAQSVSVVQGAPLMPTVQLDPRVDGWLLRHNAATLQPMHDSFVPYIPVISPYRAPYGQVVLENRGSQP